MMNRGLSMMLLFLLFTCGAIKAQVKRGLWEYGPVMTTVNNPYGWVAENLKAFGFSSAGEGGIEFWNNNRWWIPSFRSRFGVPQSIESPAGTVKQKYANWGFRNYAVGYHFGYISYVSHIGFDVQVDYERQTWRAKFPGETQYTNYSKQMVVPTVLLKTRLGDFVNDKYNFIAEAGVKYNYAFDAKGGYSDTKSINDGFTGVWGIGIINSYTHFTMQLRYEYDFFNYFNEDFSPDGATMPYDGVKTKHGVLNLYFSFGF